MNGGINATRGYLFQYLICILNSLQDNWSSVIIEPSDAEDKVDILWLYEVDGKVSKKAVQVKSTQNQFGKPKAINMAQDLKNNFKDADFYELVLIGHASIPLLKYIKESEEQGVRILHPKVPDLESFMGDACHKLDKYLEEKYATQLPWHQLEDLVFCLLGKLQYYSTNKIEIARGEFENKLLCWIESYINSVDYELQDSKNFHRLYGFDAAPRLRIAINKYYNQARKTRRTDFKKCQNFLDVKPDSTNLKVVYHRDEMLFFYFSFFMLIIVFAIEVMILIFAAYNSWKFVFLLLAWSPLLFSFASLIRPYCLAKKIDKELEELYRIK